MYFKDFSTILYDFEINGERKITRVKDITKNVRIRTEILSNITLYDEYDIIHGETPEIVAERIYGSPEYHWVVMLCNQRYDWIADFPLTQLELNQYVTDKYGAGNEDDVHHYVDANGYEVDSSQSGATSVSNRQYEETQNESKRRIKLISPNLLFKILKSFEDLI